MYPHLERPDWDYEHFQEHAQALPTRAEELLINLRLGLIDSIDSCKDSRPQHHFFFTGLTPEGHDYFAGHYRGEDYPGLKLYEVGVSDDHRVGVHSSLVLSSMYHFSNEIENALLVLEEAHKLPFAQLSSVDRLLFAVRMACKFFVEFLRVHPYANGNGHMSRFLIFGFLGTFNIWPKRWPLNDRPPDPPYSQHIINYRNGYFDGLEQFVLKCVLGTV